jgi:hypothetical protein
MDPIELFWKRELLSFGLLSAKSVNFEKAKGRARERGDLTVAKVSQRTDADRGMRVRTKGGKCGLREDSAYRGMRDGFRALEV